MKRAYAMGEKPLDVVCKCGTAFTRTPRAAAHGDYQCPRCRAAGSCGWKRAHGIPKAKRFSAEAFWGRVDRSGSCWLWTGSKNSDGYGNVSIRGRLQKVHRVAYELERGPIRAGGHVLHSCDTPACVNPIHLWVGTHADNMRDCARKGRIRGTAAKRHALEESR